MKDKEQKEETRIGGSSLHMLPDKVEDWEERFQEKFGDVWQLEKTAEQTDSGCPAFIRINRDLLSFIKKVRDEAYLEAERKVQAFELERKLTEILVKLHTMPDTFPEKELLDDFHLEGKITEQHAKEILESIGIYRDKIYREIRHVIKEYILNE